MSQKTRKSLEAFARGGTMSFIASVSMASAAARTSGTTFCATTCSLCRSTNVALPCLNFAHSFETSGILAPFVVPRALLRASRPSWASRNASTALWRFSSMDLSLDGCLNQASTKREPAIVRQGPPSTSNKDVRRARFLGTRWGQHSSGLDGGRIEADVADCGSRVELHASFRTVGELRALEHERGRADRQTPISWSLSPHKVWRTCLTFASSLPLALGQPFCSRFRAWVSAVLCLETSASTFVRFFPSVPSMVMKPGPSLTNKASAAVRKPSSAKA